MVERYLLALRPAAQWCVPACCIALAFLVAQRSEFPESWRAPVRRVLLAGIAGLALCWAWELRWIGDDAFISFRYAENFARGHGLVFNLDERVEGYTNFLWTVLIAIAIKFGANPVQASVVLGFASFAALLWLTTRVARQTAPPGSTPVVSLAALACAAQYLLASFATSGLETMLGSALVMAALERALAGRIVFSGLLAIFAAMTHPDHAIFYASLWAALLLDRPNWRVALRFLWPFALVFLPYFIWRTVYYGDLFPNTYYAKSADQSYFSQGAVFAMATVIGTGLWAVLPFAFLGWWNLRSTLFGRFCAIAIPLFTLYVIKIGGDFMYGRLFCPLIAPLLLLCERAIRQLCARDAFIRAAVGLSLLTLTVLPVRLFKPYEKRWHLADERTFYGLKSFSPPEVESLYVRWAEILNGFFGSHAQRPRLALLSVGIVSYYTGLPILDCFGLNDRGVAKRPIAARGRPGHEKGASPGYIAARNVDIAETPIYPAPYLDITRVGLDSMRFFIVHYNPLVFEPLRNHQRARVPDVTRHLRRLARLPVTPERKEEIGCDAWFAEELYFSHMPTNSLRRQFQRNLLDAGRPAGVTSTDAELYNFRHTHRVDRATAFHFEPEEAKRFGKLKRLAPGFAMRDTRAPQASPKNQRGAFLNTFVLPAGDAARGRLRSTPFPIVGDVMELLVAGGRARENLSVNLLIDDKVVHSSGGCDTEMLGSKLWQIGSFKGKRAVLEIVDRSTQGWGHLIVDEVVQWVRKTPP